MAIALRIASSYGVVLMFADLQRKWDDLCTQCGQCCYKRDRVQGELVIDRNSPCQFLDTDTQLCTVYESRLSTCANCKRLTIFHALFSPYLPDDCGYVEKFRKWRRPANAHQCSAAQTAAPDGSTEAPSDGAPRS